MRLHLIHPPSSKNAHASLSLHSHQATLGMPAPKRLISLFASKNKFYGCTRRPSCRLPRRCNTCGGRHRSEAKRLRCSRQHPARPIAAIRSQCTLIPVRKCLLRSFQRLSLTSSEEPHVALIEGKIGRIDSSKIPNKECFFAQPLVNVMIRKNSLPY
jgi:hypothetical protein